MLNQFAFFRSNDAELVTKQVTIFSHLLSILSFVTVYFEKALAWLAVSR